MREIDWIEKKRGRRTAVPAGIRVSVNKNGTKDDGSPRYAVVFSFDNGIEKEITGKEHIQVGISGDRIYFAGADSKRGYKLCGRKETGRTSVKTCQFQVEDHTKWLFWEGAYEPFVDPENKLYYIDIAKKKGSIS